jgi:hypothetical protein
MASTIFNNTVTQIPSGWANDVNRIIYDVLGAPVSFTALQSALGLNPVINGGSFTVTGGSINGTAIGATQPSTGVFTKVRVNGTDSGVTDVVTHGQLAGAIAGATGTLESMAYQSAGAVAVTGGNLNGISIGNVVPGPGRFTTLRANNPVSGTDVVNIQTLETLWATLPSFGNMATQDKNSVNIDGGYIDGTSIGANVPAEGWFTNVNAGALMGATSKVWLDGSAPGANNYAALFDLTSTAALDLGFRLKAGASLDFLCPDGNMTFTDGRLAINVVDNGIHALQVGGAVRATEVVLGNILPTAANSAASKNYTDIRDAVVQSSIAPAITAALAALGNIVTQNTTAINFTGGAIDGVIIGGISPAQGTFTQVNTNLLLGSKAALRLDGTGGYSNSAAVLSADDSTRPNVSIIPNANGAFVVMAGSTPVLRAHVNGRTVVGAGGEDGLNTLQVHGDAIVHGKITLDGGTMTGTTVPSFGTSAPAMTSSTPIWTRIRVNTVDGPVECVVPAFRVL